MTEIHIEREGRPIWQWGLLVLLLLAAVGWFAIGRSTSPDPTAQSPVSPVTNPGGSSGTDIAGAPAAVNEYLRYAADHQAQDADHAHGYTAGGIRLLAAALSALAERDASSDSTLGSRARALADRADALQRNPASTEHARYARQAFDTASVLMGAMPNAGAARAASHVDAMRSASVGVSPDGLLLPQAGAIQHFFDQAASALRAIATPVAA